MLRYDRWPQHGAAEDAPVLAAFDTAPLPDEPQMEEECEADLEAIEDYHAGRVPMHSGADVHDSHYRDGMSWYR